ncbi:MAG: hypothetical protein GY679_04165 [Mycoplasma sp.]|nr:hypothetical protein [Mycoplasma sp.]
MSKLTLENQLLVKLLCTTTGNDTTTIVDSAISQLNDMIHKSYWVPNAGYSRDELFEVLDALIELKEMEDCSK